MEGWWKGRGGVEEGWRGSGRVDKLRGRKKQKREGGRMEKSNLVILISRSHLGDEKDYRRKPVIIYIHTW